MSVDCFDSEPVDVHQSGMRRARKEHRCHACRELIRRGDLYHYTFLVFEGETEQTKRCARCELMWRALSAKMTSGDEWCHEALDCGHSYRERFGEDPPEEIARLAFVTPAEAQALLAGGAQ